MTQAPRVTKTEQEIGQFPHQSGYGFSIEKLGSGIASGEYSPVLELVYKDESDAIEAEHAIRKALDSVTHIQGHDY